MSFTHQKLGKTQKTSNQTKYQPHYLNPIKISFLFAAFSWQKMRKQETPKHTHTHTPLKYSALKISNFVISTSFPLITYLKKQEPASCRIQEASPFLFWKTKKKKTQKQGMKDKTQVVVVGPHHHPC